MIELKSDFAAVKVSPYGGQVMAFVPVGGEDVLWRTGVDFLHKAEANGKALRGGVPICWPWFGRGAGPNHGIARIRAWEVLSAGPMRAELVLSDQGLLARLEVRVDDGLNMVLETVNEGDEVREVTCAFHTYLSVGEVESTRVEGLEGLGWVDLVDDSGHIAVDAPVRFAGEVDRVYGGAGGRVLKVLDGRREIVLDYGEAPDAVVWNPGEVKAAGLDISPGGWREFVCVEGGFVKAPVRLAPGGRHVLTARMTCGSVRPL